MIRKLYNRARLKAHTLSDKTLALIIFVACFVGIILILWMVGCNIVGGGAP